MYTNTHTLTHLDVVQVKLNSAIMFMLYHTYIDALQYAVRITATNCTVERVQSYIIYQ